MNMRRARKAEQKKRRHLPEASPWAFKRARQAGDIAAIEAGRLTPDQLIWFSGGRARAMRSHDPNY